MDQNQTILSLTRASIFQTAELKQSASMSFILDLKNISGLQLHEL